VKDTTQWVVTPGKQTTSNFLRIAANYEAVHNDVIVIITMSRSMRKIVDTVTRLRDELSGVRNQAWKRNIFLV
jgi:hypothetical protein